MFEWNWHEKEKITFSKLSCDPSKNPASSTVIHGIYFRSWPFISALEDVINTILCSIIQLGAVKS
jgi:hypothetical protein